MSDLLSALNDRQQEAVLATEGYVRVIAGAGSGKTKLLVSRYAYLVKEYNNLSRKISYKRGCNSCSLRKAGNT